ncbi:MAG: hypothetical protein WCT12_04990 [Verrucomicrobiota bacterium]
MKRSKWADDILGARKHRQEVLDGQSDDAIDAAALAILLGVGTTAA